MIPIQSKFITLTGAMLTGLCLLTVLKVLSQPLKPKISESILPDRLTVSSWTLEESGVQPTLPSAASYDQVLQARFYQFSRGTQRIKLQIGYFVNTNGDVVVLQDRLIPERNGMKPSQVKIDWENASTSGVGHYLVGHTAPGNHLFLTCMNSQGENTATREQFTDNRISYDFNLAQVGQWVLGRSQLLDKRCLWGRLSLSNASPNTDVSSLLKHIWIELQPQLIDIL